MPLMEIGLQQLSQGQECIMRWNYLATGTPAAVSFSFALTSAFGAIPDTGVYPTGTVIDGIRALQDANVNFDEVVAKDVYSVTDFYGTTFVPALVGAQGGNTLGPVPAYGFRTNRTRLDIRRGTKRVTGVPSGAMGGDNVYVASTITLLSTLAAAMTETLTYDDEGNTLTFQPVIVGREKYLPDGNEPPKYAYRYYPTFAEQSDHLMSSIIWDYYTTVRTQTSRQIGRGR